MENKTNEPKIICPNCKTEFELSQALIQPIKSELKNKYDKFYQEKINAAKDETAQKVSKDAEQKYQSQLQSMQNEIKGLKTRNDEIVKKEMELNKKAQEVEKLKTDFESEKQKIIKAEKEKIKQEVKNESILEVENLKKQITYKESIIKNSQNRELELQNDIKKFKDEKDNFELEKQRILNVEREKLKNAGKNEALLEIKDLKSQIDEKEIKLKQYSQNELKLRKEKRELEESKRDFEIEVERKLDEERKYIFQKVKQDSEKEFIFKMKEKDEQLESLTKTIKELKKKSEQGSQQLQGEVQELLLEEFLKDNFIYDEFKPVAKGQKGADILQIVKNSFGQECGSILWESKRTKNWSKDWIPKLRDDQRNAKANVAVIISQELPEEIYPFGLKDGVWIGGFNTSLGIATALREKIIQINQIKNSETGKNQKMETLYSYLTSHEFSQHIEAIVEAFESLKKQIDDEKKAFEKQWAVREKLLTRVIKNTSGMHGDLQGLIGKELPKINSLELPEATDKENEKFEIESNEIDENEKFVFEPDDPELDVLF